MKGPDGDQDMGMVMNNLYMDLSLSIFMGMESHLIHSRARDMAIKQDQGIMTDLEEDMKDQRTDLSMGTENVIDLTLPEENIVARTTMIIIDQERI